MRIICHGLKTEDFPVEFINHEISIGSEESNVIVIAAAGISRRHAILIDKDGDLYIKDNGSLNGTYLNRQAVKDTQKISSGDIIQIGIQQIKVDFSSAGTATLSFISNILEEDNSEASTAMTVLADSGILNRLQSGGDSNQAPADSSSPKKIVITSTKDVFIEGREIGKYVIVKRIGKGGMGEIYLARHKTLGTYRALKVLPKEMQEDNAKFYERFIREAKLASEIRHPNVVAVMDIETDTSFGFSYIVMEYIDGGSLRRILKSNKNLPEEQSVVIVEAIASALRAAEEHNIVHRDIKPDNIMFTKQGEIKLADLGIAKNDEEDNELTKTNVMIGTPAYLPPEQVQDAKTVDGRADIYSLGATFYEMLTGQHPYPGKTTYEILHKLFSDPVPDPRKINPGISAASAAIVMKMLAKDAKERFQTAGELLEAMDRTFPPHTANESAELIKKLIAGICENNTTFSSGISMTSIARRARFRKNLKWVYLSLLCIVCFVGVLYYLFHQPTDIRTAPPPPVPAPAPISEKRYDLQIKTTPDSEIRFIFPDGLVRVYSSGHDGLLKISGLKAGNYQVDISRKNYCRLVRNLSLKKSMTLDTPMKADLKKLIVNAIPGSMVKIVGVENREQSTTVPAKGFVVFSGLREDTLNIRITLAGWESYDQTLLLNKDKELKTTQKRILAALTVRTAPFAEIWLKQGDKKIYSAKANSQGISVIEGVPVGKYQLKISCPGFHDKETACVLELDRTFDIELTRITYELRISAAADTRITLFLDHRLLGTYLVPENGLLHLPDMLPGSYSVAAEKKGMIGKRWTVLLDRDKTVDCKLAKASPPAEAETLRPSPRHIATAGKRIGGNEASGDSSGVITKKTGMIKVYFLASAELMDYIRKDGVELRIGRKTWPNIRKFPWSQTIMAGKYPIYAKAAGIKELHIPQFTVIDGRENECLLEPVVIPSSVSFASNRAEADIAFNDSSFQPGDEAVCETFREYSATATYKGEKIVRTFRSKIPGDRLKVEFIFADKEHPMQKKYMEGMKFYSERKYKDALKSFMPAAEAGHKDAARKVAEIYEKGLGMWFSDSSKAMKWYWKAAEFGDNDAAFKVALAIDQGDCDGTALQMLNFYLKASALKKADIFYRISTLFKDGYKEIPQDDVKALHYLQLAAEGGHPDAMFDLGMRYEKGHGVTLNIQTALRWINKAADAGHEKAKRYRSNIKL